MHFEGVQALYDAANCGLASNQKNQVSLSSRKNATARGSSTKETTTSYQHGEHKPYEPNEADYNNSDSLGTTQSWWTMFSKGHDCNKREPHFVPVVIQHSGNFVWSEVWNAITHGAGTVWAIIAMGFLINKTLRCEGDLTELTCVLVYTFAQLAMFLASTLYHSFFRFTRVNYVFEIMDHAGIHLLIAGTYTPFVQVRLSSVNKTFT